jgi:hypothetical protein
VSAVRESRPPRPDDRPWTALPSEVRTPWRAPPGGTSPGRAAPRIGLLAPGSPRKPGLFFLGSARDGWRTSRRIGGTDARACTACLTALGKKGGTRGARVLGAPGGRAVGNYARTWRVLSRRRQDTLTALRRVNRPRRLAGGYLSPAGRPVSLRRLNVHHVASRKRGTVG